MTLPSPPPDASLLHASPRDTADITHFDFTAASYRASASKADDILSPAGLAVEAAAMLPWRSARLGAARLMLLAICAAQEK